MDFIIQNSFTPNNGEKVVKHGYREKNVNINMKKK